MASLEQIILEEYEGPNLDFKAIQYKKEKFEDFLIDIVSMANAITKKTKNIIIGVNALPSGKKDFVGIQDDFIDEATYQQLTNENIEPEIQLCYFPLRINGVLLGVFSLTNCDNPPYMLKKDYGKLKRGDSFIRKGSHQTRITRKDIDHFYQLSNEKRQKIEELKIAFLINGKNSSSLKIIEDIKLPSKKAADKIKRILEEKEAKLALLPPLQRLMFDKDIPQIGGMPYENRSTKTLREDFEKVKETYQEDDLYYLQEEKSYKINFELLNTGKVYLEDSSIEIEVAANKGFAIVSKIILKPDRRSFVSKINSVPIPIIPENIHYPEVKKTEVGYRIFASIGNLKHLLPTKAFITPIRIIVTEEYPLNELTFKIRVFGKSLETPIESQLQLTVLK